MILIVRITDSGPLSFRDGRSSAGASTLKYVPGAALLGGLAWAHTALRNDQGEFDAFFMGPASSFGDLYPSCFMHEDLAGDTEPVYPLPLTARSCKRSGGFRMDQDNPTDEPPHGVFDALIPCALFALSGQNKAVALSPLKACPVCGEPLEGIGGFYRRDRDDKEVIGRAEVVTGLRTHTGINRATGAVQQGIMYSRETIGPGATFWGQVSVPDKQAEPFCQFVEQANESSLLRLGNNRTRGYGRVTLLVTPGGEPDSTDSLRKRIQAFDAQLRKAARATDIETPHQLYLPLTLGSDAIVFDHLLRHQAAIAPDYLSHNWRITGAELIVQNSSTRRIMGWNDLYRLPKPDQMAITKGSVFLIGLTEAPDDGLWETLLRMQNEGIGARRREGFGRLRVASPFHWELYREDEQQ